MIPQPATEANSASPLAAIQLHYPDARPESDGSISFTCDVCENEGHLRKRVTRYQNGALSCERFASAGREANRQHCKPHYERLGLDSSKLPAFISEKLLDGKLTLEIYRAERGKQRIVARNCESVLGRDVIALDRMTDRARFITSLPLTLDERKQVAQKMIEMADRFDRVQAAVDDEEEETTEAVIFKDLPDGRLLEQIAGGQFAVYDPQSNAVEIRNKIEYEGVIYIPITDDPTVAENELHLPWQLSEYDSEKLLDEETEDYLAHFCDAPSLELRFSAKLIRLSYIQDRLLEVPYLHAFGPGGSGKTRFTDVVGMACHRPLMLVSGTASSTFRICEQYTPTLCFDEFNPQLSSEDTEAMIQILNAGFQRRRKVPRTEKGPNGAWITKFYRPFGIKIFSGLKLTGSFPFESRTIPVMLSTTRRKDIEFCDTGEIDARSLPLREKLTLWRLRNWHRDYQSLIRETEALFKQREVLPRYVQIGVPLGMLIKDDDTRNKFIASLETRTKDARQEQSETIDGQIVAAIHQLLTIADDEPKDEESKTVRLRAENGSALVFGEPCALLSIHLLLEACAESLPEKVQLQKERGKITWLGKQVKNLGMHTQKILNRDSSQYEKRAIVLEVEALEKLFSQFSLPLPTDFSVSSVSKPGNSLPDQEVKPADTETEGGNDSNFSVSRLNVKESAVYEFADTADTENQEKVETKTEEAIEAENYATQFAIVALDTETERFDKKLGIGPHNCRMIGLAVCYDGKKADYVTDQEAWQMMMPEQVTIFHNAKFDFGVLKRARLPLPAKWEDTLIAAHLLEENGEHGLKPLASVHLGIADPLTFEEADQMRLLDPEIFNEYARNDSRYTFRLWQLFKPQLEAQGLTKVYELEKQLVPVVTAMEDAGMKLDLQMLKTLGREVGAELERIREEVFDYASCRFDLNSPQSVGAILYDKLGVPSNKTTNSGQRSVNHQALDEVRGYHPAVDALLRFREIDKLANTFLSVLPKFADEHGRIHPEFKSLGAVTGRFSCSNPNVQQIPARSELGKRLRRAFTADEGSVLIAADYSQVELRVLAHYSRDPLLIEAYTAETETDLHSLTASKMFRKDIADVDKRERSISKMINFGIAYGITAKGLFNRLNPAGVKVSEAECEQFINDYWRTYPSVRQFLNKAADALRSRSYVKNLFGRRRRLKGETAREIRQAQNFIIQATAADIAKSAMVRLSQSLPVGARLIAMVHDEFIVECREAEAEQVRAMMIEVMTDPPQGFSIPLKVDAKIGGNWGECK